jgi:tRNA-2-methylthio-N6-dimethylallyladenosine synthase
VTSYGRREIPFIDKKSPFVQLLEQLNEIDGLERIRFTSPHPRGFKEDLVEAYGRLDKLCEYAHLPVQSGSDRILKAMNRPYSVDRYMQLVRDLRAVQPDMYFSTDIIVGFPGETDQDFQMTCDMFEEIGFDMAFIFKYSPRSGTPAAELHDDVPKTVKEERNQILLKILEKQSRRRNASLVGTIQEILVECPARKGEGMFMGRTRGFRKVIFPASQRLIGEMVDVEIEESSVTTLKGRLSLTGVDTGMAVAT